MRFGAAFWIQRTTWPALRDACVAAEAAGFDSLWLDDHLLSDEGDWADPKLEGWTTLAALSPLTSRARLGLLVAANTFRNPGLTAKMATTIDHLSDGRFVLGIGGGWFEREHEAFGLDFGSGFGERLDRLEESVDLVERLLAGERVTHAGRFYSLVDAICEPRPIQARLPILIGGEPIAERHALVGRVGSDGSPRGLSVAGPPDEVAAHVQRFAEIGVAEVMWIFRDPFDLESMAALGAVRGALGQRAPLT